MSLKGFLTLRVGSCREFLTDRKEVVVRVNDVFQVNRLTFIWFILNYHILTKITRNRKIQLVDLNFRIESLVVLIVTIYLVINCQCKNNFSFGATNLN